MFLPKTTLANVQSQFNADALSYEQVIITAIHATPKATHIRYTLDGKDAVSVVITSPGQRLHELLDDSIRWKAYYLMDEIRTGKELDEEVERIVRIWPVAVKPAEVVELRPAEQPRVKQQSLDALQSKFGTRAVSRSARK